MLHSSNRRGNSNAADTALAPSTLSITGVFSNKTTTAVPRYMMPITVASCRKLMIIQSFAFSIAWNDR